MKTSFTFFLAILPGVTLFLTAQHAHAAEAQSPPAVIYTLSGQLNYENLWPPAFDVVPAFSREGATFEWEAAHNEGIRRTVSRGAASGGELTAQFEAYLDLPARAGAWADARSQNFVSVWMRGMPGTPYFLESTVSGLVQASVEPPRGDSASSASLNSQGVSHGSTNGNVTELTVVTNGISAGPTAAWFGTNYTRVFTQPLTATVHGHQEYCIIGCYQYSVNLKAVTKGQAVIRAHLRSGLPPIAIITGSMVDQPTLGLMGYGYVGEPLVMSGKLSHDPDNAGPDKGIVRWRWEVTAPDGTKSQLSGVLVSFIPHQPGRFTIQLTVTDDEGMEGSTTDSINVVAGRNRVCFYADCPDPAWDTGLGLLDTGHSSMGLFNAQGESHYYGFYPGAAPPLSGCVKGAVADDRRRPKDQSICFYINDDQYNRLVAEIEADTISPPSYCFSSFNCTDWIADKAGSIGITLPPVHNLLGIADPMTFCASIVGGSLMGEILSPSVAELASDSGPAPFSFSYSFLIEQSHLQPEKICSALKLPLVNIDLGQINLGVGWDLTIELPGLDLSQSIISVAWGDASWPESKKLQFRHVYSSTTNYSGSVVIIGPRELRFYRFTVSVAPEESSDELVIRIPEQSTPPVQLLELTSPTVPNCLPPRLGSVRMGNGVQLQLYWTMSNCVLEASSAVEGIWKPFLTGGQVSTVTLTNQQQFYRLRAEQR